MAQAAQTRLGGGEQERSRAGRLLLRTPVPRLALRHRSLRSRSLPMATPRSLAHDSPVRLSTGCATRGHHRRYGARRFSHPISCPENGLAPVQVQQAIGGPTSHCRAPDVLHGRHRSAASASDTLRSPPHCSAMCPVRLLSIRGPALSARHCSDPNGRGDHGSRPRRLLQRCRSLAKVLEGGAMRPARCQTNEPQ